MYVGVGMWGDGSCCTIILSFPFVTMSQVMLEQKISRKPEKLMPGQSTMKDLYTNTQQWAGLLVWCTFHTPPHGLSTL